MWIADNWKDYEILDCSGGEKLGEIIFLSVRTRRSSGILLRRTAVGKR